MSYKINNIVSTTPTGSIMAFLGTTDPEGWVICDGVQRTNNSDSRYNGLNTLGIGSGGNGTTNYTPPNYKGAFLRGIGYASNTTYTGPTSVNTTQNDATAIEFNEVAYTNGFGYGGGSYDQVTCFFKTMKTGFATSDMQNYTATKNLFTNVDTPI